MTGKVNVRDLDVDLGVLGDDAGYTVGGPNKIGGMHHSIFTGVEGEHYSFDTDAAGNVVDGHRTPPESIGGEITSVNPPSPKKPGVRVVFDPECLWD
ncbi:hypothetical protein M1555_04060 [Patescibacteria group bacterium]|nr:hypothetical protein [Patescibacteria group bacterium]